MSLHPKIIDLTLDRVWRLLEALGNPQDKLPPVVHIAGTNGKGSTLAMIRAGIEAAGLTAHAYTSPHLTRFHERIRIAGDLISEPDLTSVLDECYDANNGADITYFEITTCAALLAMSRVPADFTLLEVGLGGRLDATNVIAQPALTVITPVSLDHQQFLGDTLPEIAGEKAGILKPKVPCVVGRQEENALDTIEARAARTGSRLLTYSQNWHVTSERERLIYQDETGLCDLTLPKLPGAHQIQNAGMALAALRELGFKEPALEGAMTGADWPARLQRLTQGPLAGAAPLAEIWLDGGHNPAAGDALAAHLSGLSPRPTYMICGMLNTKDISGYLRPLVPHVAALYAVSIPGEANTLSAQDTAQHAKDVGITAQTAETVPAGLERIVSDAPAARVLICGSLYLAGHVLRHNS